MILMQPISKTTRIAFIDEIITNAAQESNWILDAIYHELSTEDRDMKLLISIHDKLMKVAKIYSALIFDVSGNIKYFNGEIDGRMDSLLELHRKIVDEIDAIQGQI